MTGTTWTPEHVAAGLGWPEGPALLGDGRLLFVESYRSQLTALGPDRAPRRFAYTAGAPNSCVLGGDGAVYVCQNGGTVGPWRAAELTRPSIQRVREGGAAEILLTSVAGIALNGPNDLVFCPDGRLVFTDPGTYNPASPDPSYIFAVAQRRRPLRPAETRRDQFDLKLLAHFTAPAVRPRTM